MRHFQLSTLRRALLTKKARFIAVGILNTMVDYAVLNIVLVSLHTSAWVANLCSTSVAMIVSFLLNKNTVFKGSRRYSHMQFVAYIIVTAVGVWGLQTIVIVTFSGVLRPLVATFFGKPTSSTVVHLVVANSAKAAATVLSAIWNYLWYDRVIFADSSAKNKVNEWI